jgi:hypothetical protein
VKALLPEWLKRTIVAADEGSYRAVVWLLFPVNRLLAWLCTTRVEPRSVLHVSAMVHVPYYTVRILREHGVSADYLAVGDSPWWSEADYHFRPLRVPVVSVLKEMWWVWRVVSRYEIFHSHFIVTVSRDGWEWPLLKRMGRKIVVHYRGCEIRDREENQRLHPQVNICQECDYTPFVCRTPINVRRRPLAARYGDAFLVTTPDMKDFVPSAMHLRFFTPPAETLPSKATKEAGTFKIVHATNHPGIEGTRQIRQAVDALVAKGYPIEFVCLQGVPHERVLEELADADLSIGKMKMGYYANAQVESLAIGAPAVTWVRDDLMTEELLRSGFIFSTLEALETTLEHLLTHPDELEAKRRVARDSVRRLHPNEEIAGELKCLYARLAAR